MLAGSEVDKDMNLPDRRVDLDGAQIATRSRTWRSPDSDALSSSCDRSASRRRGLLQEALTRRRASSARRRAALDARTDRRRPCRLRPVPVQLRAGGGADRNRPVLPEDEEARRGGSPHASSGADRRTPRRLASPTRRVTDPYRRGQQLEAMASEPTVDGRRRRRDGLALAATALARQQGLPILLVLACAATYGSLPQRHQGPGFAWNSQSTQSVFVKERPWARWRTHNEGLQPKIFSRRNAMMRIDLRQSKTLAQTPFEET